MRGQVLALRAAVPSSKFERSGWVANDGFEYWFPRPTKQDENPIVILGGGREASKKPYELYVEDDSVLNEEVSKVLKGFLPGIFEGKYEEGREPEMEWVCYNGFSFMDAN